MLLEILGNEIRMAHYALEGVSAAEQFRPDAVLLDIGLPKMNGYKACRRILERPWGKSVVLIALTSWDKEAGCLRSQEAGFDRHLVKPVEPEEVMGMLAVVSGAKV